MKSAAHQSNEDMHYQVPFYFASALPVYQTRWCHNPEEHNVLYTTVKTYLTHGFCFAPFSSQLAMLKVRLQSGRKELISQNNDG
jgi:hypothetical protein